MGVRFTDDRRLGVRCRGGGLIDCMSILQRRRSLVEPLAV